MKFSEKMEEVEMIVSRLENEALPLEEALLFFEKGVGLIRECQLYLAEAKQKVSILSSGEREIPFPPSGQNEEE